MKKIIGSLTAIFLLAFISTLTAASQALIEPNFPMHGNQCGTVIVESAINRDIYIKIVQNSPDGKYIYYDYVISDDAQDRECKFAVEGKDDVDYTVNIGVPRFKGSADNLTFSDNIVVYDTDEITDQRVSEYKFTYQIGKSDIEEIEVSRLKENVKNSDNVIENNTEILFPSPDYQRGDADCDGKIAIKDARYIAKLIADQKRDEIPPWADFNEDGNCSIRDALEIARYLAHGGLKNYDPKTGG